MKMVWKLLKIGCIAISICLVMEIGLYVYFFLGEDTNETQDITYYRAISGELDAPNSLQILGEQIDIPACPYDLPWIDQLGEGAVYRFHYQAKRESLFQSHGYLLIVSYPREDYLSEVDALNAKYVWRTEEIEGPREENGEPEGLSPDFELDGFRFRAVQGGRYPEEMLLIGTSEEHCEIAYFYFWDQDLDSIASSLQGFVREYSGWDQMVR